MPISSGEGVSVTERNQRGLLDEQEPESEEKEEEKLVDAARGLLGKENVVVTEAGEVKVVGREPTDRDRGLAKHYTREIQRLRRREGKELEGREQPSSREEGLFGWFRKHF